MSLTSFDLRTKLSPLLALSLIATACGDPTGPDGVVGEFVESDGIQRTYRMHLPPSYTGDDPVPLVLFFHGGTQQGSVFQRMTGLDSIADRLGFVAVYPDGTSNSWALGCDCSLADIDGVDDLKFTRDLLSQLKANLAIDASRIYAAGLSQGALFSHQLACKMANDFAAVASVAAIMIDVMAADCSPSRPMPIMFIHGLDDILFPWFGGDPYLSLSASFNKWADFNECTGSAVETDLPDIADDATTTTIESHTTCDGASEVLLYTILGGGHTWPGSDVDFGDAGGVSQDFSASEVIVEFMLRHTRN